MKKLFLSVFLLLSLAALHAQSLSALRDVCPRGAVATINGSLVVEGVVVSDWRSENMELNRSLTSVRMDLRDNQRTAYIQTANGNMGVRLVFDEASENRLERYDNVVLDLIGCEITRTVSPDAITIKGVRARNFLVVRKGNTTNIPLKEKYISDLTDDDLYTCVTLKDVDVVFKDGSWANVYEPFVPYSSTLHSEVEYTPSGRMDGWATLLRDANGQNIYVSKYVMSMAKRWQGRSFRVR